MVVWWGVLLIAIAGLILGGIIAFFITKKVFQKQLRDNPPINANQIRAMYRQMGRAASERDVQKVMQAMRKAR